MLYAPLDPPLPLGRWTKHGRIAGVGFTGGERYYWLTDDVSGAISMQPWFMIEPDIDVPAPRSPRAGIGG